MSEPNEDARTLASEAAACSFIVMAALLDPDEIYDLEYRAEQGTLPERLADWAHAFEALGVFIAALHDHSEHRADGAVVTGNPVEFGEEAGL